MRKIIRGVTDLFKRIGTLFVFLWKIKLIVFLLLAGLSVFLAMIYLPIYKRELPLITIYIGYIAFALIAFVLMMSVALDRLAQTMGIGIQALMAVRTALNHVFNKLNDEINTVKNLNRTIERSNELETKRQEESQRTNYTGQDLSGDRRSNSGS